MPYVIPYSEWLEDEPQAQKPNPSAPPSTREQQGRPRATQTREVPPRRQRR